MKFEQYHIAPEIKNNLALLGFKRPTDIQFKAIPSILKGEDVLAIAQTGTGKTAAFAIPIIDRIHKNKSSKRTRGIQCIVMAPTRELALQIGGVFRSLAKDTRVKAFSLHGGVDQDPQIRTLQDGIDVLIATPGRMFDLISQGYLRVDHIDTLVLDEADHMLDLGFIKDIKEVKRKLTQKHQTLFFSATINDEIKKLAYSQVKSVAIRIQLSPEDPVSKNVSHFVMAVEMDDKRFFLERFIRDHPDEKMIVFVRTRIRAERVGNTLQNLSIPCLVIHGEKDQAERTEVMKRFREGECTILIATDVTARGIDIPDVAYVINFDLPEKPENYVHRVGRTGRGVRKGVAVSFYSKGEKERLQEIQTLLHKPVEEIRIGKRDYAETIRKPDKKADLHALIRDQELWEEKKKKKKGAKGGRKRK